MHRSAWISRTLAATIFCTLWLWLSIGSAQQEVNGGQPDSGKMVWVPASNSTALCNDFTRAGFFIRQNQSSRDWVVFLESGGLCYNTESCNRRFFVRQVREEFRDNEIPAVIPYGSIDPSRTWNETIQSGRDPASVISPLMTSMKCFENVTEYFPSGLSSSIEGRDILDPDPVMNRLFHSYNHVVIPYCSSDVWLGEETTNTEAVEMGTSHCDCFNYTTSSNQNGCFNFNPNSQNVQFTFRGKIIYQSIIRQLLANYGMDNADRVILAGSSAGGLGVTNHAKWTRETLNSSTELKVFFDSAWFIDFQDGIEMVFNGEVTSSTSNDNNRRLLDILSSNSACNDTDRLGYPCCISAHCVMTQRNSDGELQYYPEDTPTFALFSIYDIYLLAPGLARVASLDSAQEMANTGDGNGGVSVLLDVLRVIGEYGGAMNNTLDTVFTQAPFLSYYVTQCFQHIYLATSTLWGEDGQSVFGTDSVEFTRGSNSFSQNISPDRWRRQFLSADRSRSPATIFDALSSWLTLTGSGKVYYTDTCQGILCNSQCPDDLRLGELTSNNWHTGAKIFIAILIAGLAAFTVLGKILFCLWLLRLEKKQRDYLKSLKPDSKIEVNTTLQHSQQFPHCESNKKISVSCLDLCYSVKWKKRKEFKDEKKDETSPVVLHDLVEEEEESKEGPLANIDLDSAQEYVSTKRPSIFRKRRKLVKQKLSYDQELEAVGGIDLPEEYTVEYKDKRRILRGVSVIFNPGQMVGIMGPSGCGKTTLLDLLTGRRKTGFIEGTVYINGTPIDDIDEWYTANTGYVLQLATPYYEELTVRENLILSAQMKLPSSMTLREKFERVEQIMQVTGLKKVAEMKVGGSTGPGLSGGQKKRLIIALQLLTLPSVLFLDEPTSGLDAAASFDLLTHLNKLAGSNRTVILTIHQPRLEIFHMFDHLVLLSEGKVAYHDVPYKAYEVFVNAVASRYLDHGLVIPSLLENHNSADMIMDMLGNPKLRQIITESYQSSSEPKRVRDAITEVRWKKYRLSTDEPHWEVARQILFGAKNIGEQSSTFTRMAVLEARADKKALKKTLAFLPFFMFLVFGFTLGTTYLQVNQAFLVVSGMCVFSTASALFMFPAMYLYYKPALDMYKFEKADGVGCSYEIVVQGFIRFASIAVIPVVVAVAVIYLLLINSNSYDFLVFIQVLIVNIALNQTWIALLIALICAVPGIAFRLSPIISAVAGFSSGFFIPVGVMHWGYRWLVYINPNYFGLSSIAFFVLSEFKSDCVGNQLECYISSGPYILNQFFFDKINPYLHLVILLAFTIFYLLLAIFSNWLRHTTLFSRVNKITLIFKTRSMDTLANKHDAHHLKYEKQFSRYEEPGVELPGEEMRVAENGIGSKKEVETGEIAGINVEPKKADIQSVKPTDEEIIPVKESVAPSSKEQTRDRPHKLWLPDKEPHLADLVLALKSSQKSKQPTRPEAATPLQELESQAKSSIKTRQQMLQERIQVTQAVLPHKVYKIKPKEDETVAPERRGARKKFVRQQSNLKVSDDVSEYLTKMKAEGVSDAASSVKRANEVASTPSGATADRILGLRRKYDTQLSSGQSGKCGSIPLNKWREIVRKNKALFSSSIVDSEDELSDSSV